MAVRSRLPWPWRAVAGTCVLVVVAGMWWWGFDFGQIFGGFNRKEIEARIVAVEGENAALRKENAQLQAKTMQQVGLSIQRLSVEREREDAWRYHLLLVRGGNPKEEFVGQVTLQVTVQPVAAGGPSPRPTILTLPDDQPGAGPALGLKFKYYQRLEGTIAVPSGSVVRAVTVRAFESGQSVPRATRNLVIP